MRIRFGVERILDCCCLSFPPFHFSAERTLFCQQNYFPVFLVFRAEARRTMFD
jgi:hypothetical protein